MLDYDKEAARYDATRGGDARAGAAAVAITSLIGDAAVVRTLVDVACGTGIVTARLADAGRVVLGVDRSPGMATVNGRRPERQPGGGEHGLTPATETTFAGLGQGSTPLAWRKRLASGNVPWAGRVGPGRMAELDERLAALPDQDRARADPVYRLVAFRRS